MRCGKKLNDKNERGQTKNENLNFPSFFYHHPWGRKEGGREIIWGWKESLYFDYYKVFSSHHQSSNPL